MHAQIRRDNGRWPHRAGVAVGTERNRGHAGLRIFLVVAVSVFAVGCHGRDDRWSPDGVAPVRPQGLYSMTGDRSVELYWCPNTEEDLAGYRVYRSTQPEGFFPRIATLGPSASAYVDRSAFNGVTYYYTIAAFDRAGNESDTAPVIFDTPRPAGRGLRLHNADRRPETSGYDFSEYEVLDYRDLEADIYYWRTQEAGAWMIATERSDDLYTDIQDAGYRPLDAVDFAPTEGWSPFGEVPLILGHTYIVWTWDNRFAKFRVVDITPDRVTLDWAYQSDRGNVELTLPDAAAAKPAGGGQRTHQQGLERRTKP